MPKIGIFYGSSTGHAEKVAHLLADQFGQEAVTINVADASAEDLQKFPYLILGTSTWDIGAMQDDWEDFMDQLRSADLKDKKVALYGLGDQENYPEGFADGLGVLYRELEGRTTIVGKWPAEGYRFIESEAFVDGQFVGLVIDDDNQPKLTPERVKQWADQLKKEFGL